MSGYIRIYPVVFVYNDHLTICVPGVLVFDLYQPKTERCFLLLYYNLTNYFNTIEYQYRDIITLSFIL